MSLDSSHRDLSNGIDGVIIRALMYLKYFYFFYFFYLLSLLLVICEERGEKKN